MASDEMQRAFLANNGEKPKRERTPSGTLKRGKRPAQRSTKQELLEARWAGIREGFIYMMNRLDPDGAHCNECGHRAKRLDLDHIVPRAQGGHFSASNAQLLCRRCHEAKHGTPWPERSET